VGWIQAFSFLSMAERLRSDAIHYRATRDGAIPDRSRAKQFPERALVAIFSRIPSRLSIKIFGGLRFLFWTSAAFIWASLTLYFHVVLGLGSFQGESFFSSDMAPGTETEQKVQECSVGVFGGLLWVDRKFYAGIDFIHPGIIFVRNMLRLSY
jgi:hypothetical protein